MVLQDQTPKSGQMHHLGDAALSLGKLHSEGTPQPDQTGSNVTCLAGHQHCALTHRCFWTDSCAGQLQPSQRMGRCGSAGNTQQNSNSQSYQFCQRVPFRRLTVNNLHTLSFARPRGIARSQGFGLLLFRWNYSPGLSSPQLTLPDYRSNHSVQHERPQPFPSDRRHLHWIGPSQPG